MSRGVGLISVLLAMTVALAACNGDSSGTSGLKRQAWRTQVHHSLLQPSQTTAPSTDSGNGSGKRPLYLATPPQQPTRRVPRLTA
jgi:hypothetical protein